MATVVARGFAVKVRQKKANKFFDQNKVVPVVPFSLIADFAKTKIYLDKSCSLSHTQKCQFVN